MGTSLLSAGQCNSQDTPTLCPLGLGDICWSEEDFSWRKVVWFYSLLWVSLAVSKSLLLAPSPTLSLGLNSPARNWISPESGKILNFYFFLNFFSFCFVLIHLSQGSQHAKLQILSCSFPLVGAGCQERREVILMVERERCLFCPLHPYGLLAAAHFPWMVWTQLPLFFSSWGKNCPRSWWKGRGLSPAPSEGLDVSRRH